MTPHKHAAVIKAWADGAEIEWRLGHLSPWTDISFPAWHDNYEYRVKPKPKSLGQIYYESRGSWIQSPWDRLSISTQLYMNDCVNNFVAALKANNLEIKEIR